MSLLEAETYYRDRIISSGIQYHIFVEESERFSNTFKLIPVDVNRKVEYLVKAHQTIRRIKRNVSRD